MFRLLLRISATILVACCVSTTNAFAQEASTSGSEITVTGYGLASAPAETGTLQLVIYGDDLYSGPPAIPQVEATPGATSRESMGPIVSVIESHEFVDSVTIVVPAPFGGQGRSLPVARLDIALTAPTQEGLIAVVNDAARAAADDRMQIGYIGATFGIGDCLSLEQQAREAALSSAWSQAEMQAAVLGTDLGDIESTVDVYSDDALASGYYGLIAGPDNSCDPSTPMSASARTEFSASLSTFDPVTQLPLVEVYVEIQVTFATGGAQATPAA